MTPRKLCARAWQVEAARDGRLTGSDLSNALRHRAECADCTLEARALAQLGRELKNIPVAPADPLRSRRTRQALLASWNEHLLAERGPRPKLRAGLVVAFCAAFGLALALGYPRLRRSSDASRPPLFQVLAKPGTLWTAQEAPNLTRITLRDGVATFTVRRPAGQRMLIELPDGEIEDLGTVFQVEVQKQRTLRISIREGRVLVRLHGRADFELKAGQSWQVEPSSQQVEPSSQQVEPSSQQVEPSSRQVEPSSQQPAPAPAALTRPSSISHPRQRVTRPQPGPAASHTAMSTAEDDAYLYIVDLLRNGRATEARAKAAQYLAQFPNGFRRQEVEKIASQPSVAQ